MGFRVQQNRNNISNNRNSRHTPNSGLNSRGERERQALGAQWARQEAMYRNMYRAIGNPYATPAARRNNARPAAPALRDSDRIRQQLWQAMRADGASNARRNNAPRRNGLPPNRRNAPRTTNRAVSPPTRRNASRTTSRTVTLPKSFVSSVWPNTRGSWSRANRANNYTNTATSAFRPLGMR